MKKILLSLGMFLFVCSVSSASDNFNNEKNIFPIGCKCKEECQKQCEKDQKVDSNCEKKDIEESKSACSIDEIDDDEYAVYNQCFFDRQYREMKKTLCLTRRQENCIDKMYKDFKNDMELLYSKYCVEKDKLLYAIECEDCYRQNISNLKEMKKEAKEHWYDFRDEIEELLCKSQRYEFKKFQREEKRKIKKLAKYCVVYKFPCGCNSK